MDLLVNRNRQIKGQETIRFR